MVLCMIIVSFWIIVCMSLQWYKMDMVEFMKIIVGISCKWNIEQLKQFIIKILLCIFMWVNFIILFIKQVQGIVFIFFNKFLKKKYILKVNLKFMQFFLKINFILVIM